jgi:hypothetical protein
LIATLLFPANVPLVAEGVAVIRVLAIDAADAPAREVARLSRRIQLEPGSRGPYRLEGSLAPRVARHRVEGSVDLDEDAQIGVGDLLTVQSHPVGPGGRRFSCGYTCSGDPSRGRWSGVDQRYYGVPMPGRWTVDQVRALAPDAASQRAARNLAAAGSWTGTGACDDVLWGLCAGSGKNPYQTVVDVSGPAYRCSCPSRKFPCKHALALLLLWASGSVLDAAQPPDFAAAWKADRDGRATAAARPKGEKDEKAAARRAELRSTRVGSGLDELELWLRDQVRTGLSAAAGAGYRHTEAVAARMVDAQAPGVAGALRRISVIPATGEGWPARLLTEYGQLHLLARAYAQVDTLPPDRAAVVRGRVGFPVPREDVLATDPVRDRWQVLAVRDLLDGAVPARRIWLRGAASGRFALLLLFSPTGAFAGHADGAGLVAGVELDADVHFYPGAPPLRALVGNRHGDPLSCPEPAGAGAVEQALEAFTAGLEQDPWLTELPALLAGVPVADGDSWELVDAAGAVVPLLTSAVDVWPLVAVSGGDPVLVAGEWSWRGFLPLTTWHAGIAVPL